ncbi:TolC family protein [Sphingomonas sp. HMP9]|uniref:TolC family protein n=1 Tax=Sphingomonas sp. HMP9 TaxID=1517554 RepID=UPI00159681A8|nr:TolC family protein [Sphingomonas sp. HMP9]
MTAFIGRLPRFAVAGLLAATSIVALVSPAGAQTAPPFAALLRQSTTAPRLAESEAEIERAQGVAEQARARPNPTIGVLTENVAGSSPYRGFNGAETTFQYSQPFEIGGKRSARIAAGEAGIVAARARDLDARVTYAYDLARAYAAAEISDRRIGLAEDEVEEATADLRAARALVGAGKEARLRSLQAETAIDALAAELDLAKANRIMAYARLAALAGVEQPYTGLSESLLDQDGSASIAVAIDPLQAPTYLSARAERDAAERRVTAERKRTNADVTAVVGVRRLEFDNATAAVAGVSIPLRIFDRNRGNIAASQAELRAADARLAMARYDAQAAAQAGVAQLTAAYARVAAADTAMKTAYETYRLARIAYQAGKSPLVELLAARHGLGAARGVVLDARIARLEARASLARLAGRTFAGEPIQ